MPKPNKMFFGLTALACLGLILSACSSGSGSNQSNTNVNSKIANTGQSGTAPNIMDGPPPEDMGAGGPPPDGVGQ